jgi:hypothetical protein
VFKEFVKVHKFGINSLDILATEELTPCEVERANCQDERI